MAVLYGVSVGPGDPELLTVKALKIIQACSVIAVPRTKGEHAMALSIVEQMTDLSGKEILYLDFPMTRDATVLEENYKRSAGVLETYLSKGQDVTMLNIGDVSVYSTFSYVSGIVESDGYEICCVPGVASFLAVAAKLKTPLVCGRETLTILPGDRQDLEAQLETSDHQVIMKCGHRMDALTGILKDAGKWVGGAADCGLPEEKVYDSLDAIEGQKGYFTTLIVKNQ